MNLNNFLNTGILNIANTAGRFYLGNLRGQAFILKTAASLRKGVKIREQLEQDGTHVPPFLIASISSTCNLYCTGCYARANGGCVTEKQQADMTTEQWQRVFTEASDLGISFILLAGGEPLLRPDIIHMAAKFPNIIFPIFTNGTVIDDDYLALFDKHRNLIPVLSVEGDEARTDERRGKGVLESILRIAKILKEKGILFGTSITVTKENMNDITENSFVSNWRDAGCGLIFFVEYVPAQENTDHLVLNDDDLKELQTRIDTLRNGKQNKGVMILSFPGDEEAMGGCLAAGRGFFHISASGGAEPCPFSPYSENNLKDNTLIDVLQSPFFKEVREISAAETLNHKGGCTLFQQKDKVTSALDAVSANT